MIKRKSVSIYVCLWLISLILFSACNQLEKPQPQPFYSQTAPPLKQEFRWSNGKTPKSFDPALAVAPPETDVVRAVFDGLTDTDAKTLRTIPAVAKDWKSSEDNKTWIFNLRRDAKWSNGETVKAQDFVRSWRRLTEMSEKISHPELLKNIVGFQNAQPDNLPSKDEPALEILPKNLSPENLRLFPKQADADLTNSKNQTNLSNSANKTATPVETEAKPKLEKVAEKKIGVEAVDNFTLKVTLVKPDRDFPALVAHPLFRPVYGDGKQFENGKLNADIVTNGAFRVFSVGQDGITLDRAEFYWNKEIIKLERVKFVPNESAEKALEAYRAGEIDAVTNADFEPLALKLLTPFDDFQRTAHSALNFYEINSSKKPFDDSRVREALAISINRELLTEDVLDGASLPALSFLPFSEDGKAEFAQDTNRAKNLLAEAGFPGGQNFPMVRLLINRNNVQQKIARSVAKMWQQTLNIGTEIIIKDQAELEIAEKSGDFDVLRRGVVLATTDEAANLSVIFVERENVKNEVAEKKATVEKSGEANKTIENSNAALDFSDQDNLAETPPAAESSGENLPAENSENLAENALTLTEAEAVSKARAIPLYFPTSYSLVKPYVLGFENNILDAPSLKDVRINSDWRPKSKNGE